MRIRHLSCALAVCLAAPALTVLPALPPQTGTANNEPVPVAERRVELVDAESPTAQTHADDAENATRSELVMARSQAQVEAPPGASSVPQPVVREVSTPQRLPGELAVVGVTYGTRPQPGTVVQYRTRNAGAGADDWQPWQALETDPTAGEQKPLAGQRSGSDPIVVSGADQIQVRVLGPEEAPALDARLSIIDPGSVPADVNIGASQPGAAEAAAERPRIYSRKEWGANESWRKGSPSYTTVKGVIVHHTAGTNNYSPSQVPAIMRGIYAFHTKDRGWSDIAYNFLVDKWGRVWEGRAGGVTRGVMGAHASGWNRETMGISVMGDYDKVAIPKAALTGVERVIAWKAGIHGFKPNRRATVNGHYRPVVQGHRDVGSTSCPGRYFYPQLPEVRRAAARMTYDSSGSDQTAGQDETTTPPENESNGGTTSSTTPAKGVRSSDVLMRGSSKALFRSSPIGTTGLTFADKVSSGDWAGYDKVLAAGDLTGDGIGDVVAREQSSGRLRLFPGEASGQLGEPRSLGIGWGAMSVLTGGADMTGDGRADMLAVVGRTGELLLYPGNGKGGFAPRVSLGRGWGTMRDVVALGDWDGNGTGDVLGIFRDGTAYVYQGNGSGRLVSRVRVATNFKAWSTVVGMPGVRAVLGIDGDGNGWMIRRHGTSTVRSTQVAPNFKGLLVYRG